MEFTIDPIRVQGLQKAEQTKIPPVPLATPSQEILPLASNQVSRRPFELILFRDRERIEFLWRHHACRDDDGARCWTGRDMPI